MEGFLRKIKKWIIIFLIILFFLAAALYAMRHYTSYKMEEGLKNIKNYKEGVINPSGDLANDLTSRVWKASFEWRDEEEYALRVDKEDVGGEDVWFVYETNITEGTPEEKIELDKYIETNEGFDKMFKSGFFDFEGTMLLMDDDDVDKICQRIYDDTHIFKNGYEKQFHWIKKVCEYGTHEEPVTDGDGNPVYNEDGTPQTVEVRDAHPSWFPDDKWEHKLATETELKEHFFIENERIIMYEDSVKGEIDENGHDRFVMRWPMVLAAMEMVGNNQYMYWGEDVDSRGSSKNSKLDLEKEFFKDKANSDDYYLSDDIVNQIIDKYSYTYEWWWDAYPKDADGKPLIRRYKYPDFEYIGYTLEYEEMTIPGADGDVAFVKKTPAAAPKKITNGWEIIEYNYEPSTDDYSTMVCTGRSIYWDVLKFTEWIKEICPEFDWQWYLETIELFPGSTNSYNIALQMYNVYLMQLDAGTGDPILMVDNEDCPQVGIRLGEHCGEELVNTNPDLDVGDIDYEHGDFDFIYVIAKGSCPTSGWVAVPKGAQEPLTESDNLTKEQIAILMQYFEERYDKDKNGVVGKGAFQGAWWDAVDELYDWQQSTGGSITGMLAIYIHEGACTTYIGKECWNFGNYVAGAGQPYREGSHKWLNIKAMYPDFGDALTYQLNDIYRRYWAKGQNTYHSMSWWLSGLNAEYNAQSEEEARAQLAVMGHCYCPYWESNIVPHPEKSVEVAYKGWAAACAFARAQLLSLV